MSVLLIELMRELVDDDIASIVHNRRTFHHVVPGQHHLPLRPRLARQHMPPILQHAGSIRMNPIDDERARVNEYLPQVREVIGASTIQQQQTRLRGDGDAHLVGHLQPGATDERLLGEEDLDVPLELDLQIRGQQPKVRDAPLEDLAPRVGKRPAAKPARRHSTSKGSPANQPATSSATPNMTRSSKAPPYPSRVIDAG